MDSLHEDSTIRALANELGHAMFPVPEDTVEPMQILFAA